MTRSRQIAGLVGPSMCTVLVSEFPLAQPHRRAAPESAVTADSPELVEALAVAA